MEWPIRRNQGAVWCRRRVRKATRCCDCRGPIKVGDRPWFPIVENGRRGIIRYMRMCDACMEAR